MMYLEHKRVQKGKKILPFNPRGNRKVSSGVC